MIQVNPRSLLAAGITAALLAPPVLAADAPAGTAPPPPPDLIAAITSGQAHLDFRYRYEQVDQQ